MWRKVSTTSRKIVRFTRQRSSCGISARKRNWPTVPSTPTRLKESFGERSKTRFPCPSLLGTNCSSLDIPTLKLLCRPSYNRYLTGPLERFFPSLIASTRLARNAIRISRNFSFAMCLPNKTRDFASRGAQTFERRPRFFSSYESRGSLINGCPKRVFPLEDTMDGSIVIIIFLHKPRAFIIDTTSSLPSSTFLQPLSIDLRSDTYI